MRFPRFGKKPWVYCVACGLLVAACSDDAHLSTASPPPGIALQVTSPQALTNELDRVLLFVDTDSSGLVCDPARGVVRVPAELAAGTSGLMGEDLASKDGMQSLLLGNTLSTGAPCPDGGRFCSDQLLLERNDHISVVFQAVGVKNNQPFAVGCFQGPVDTDPFRVTLKLVRYVPPAVCGDGVVSLTEQCEQPIDTPAPNDEFCSEACTSREQVLTEDHQGPWDRVVRAGPPGSKHHPALVWSPMDSTGRAPLHIVFEDENPDPASGLDNPEINYRQLDRDAHRLSSPAVLRKQIFLPRNDSEGFNARPRPQTAPAISTMGANGFAVVYEDNRNCSEGESNITLTYLSNDVQHVQEDHMQINTTGKNSAHEPAIAEDGKGHALVVWTDSQAKRVKGRFWSSFGAMSEVDKLLSAGPGSEPDVAGCEHGWVVVWRGKTPNDDDGIALIHVAPNGQTGLLEGVNEQTPGVQDQPSVAMLPDGAFIVAWRDGGSIYMQRYLADGSKVEGDQKSPINPKGTEGDGLHPSTAAGVWNGGFFAVVWGSSQGAIWGDFLSRQHGTLINFVDGQAAPFLVSDPGVSGQRQRPAVAAGGRGYVVVTWEDTSDDHSGIFMRRLPVPLSE